MAHNRLRRSRSVDPGMRAGGALAVFVVVFFFNPAKLTGVVPKTELEKELETPIVGVHDGGVGFSLIAAAEAAPVTEILIVAKPDALTPSVLSKRYARVTIQSVALKCPTD